ncbi:hypothetical protein AMK59_7440 [Oryctes borbonicus]|uniref:Uncharacterized protein n=1 Tax=Oryctes borbonicus TaxID=1629725 RepID=A0A0T6AY93_9SCAR|nr:hypothetical protein AMK59_7440 [Oryctes borbonicus]
MTTIMSSNLPEILLRNAVAMFVDDEYVNIRRSPNKEAAQNEPVALPAKFSRSKSFRESFKITFKRNTMITRSFARSKSSDCVSEDEKQETPDRRSTSASPYRDDIKADQRPVPTPLVVEDPPSSENGSDLDDVKFHNNPALLNGLRAWNVKMPARK